MEPEWQIANTIRAGIRELDIEKVRAAIAEAKESDIDIQISLRGIGSALIDDIQPYPETIKKKKLQLLELIIDAGFKSYSSVHLAGPAIRGKIELLEFLVKKNPDIDLHAPYFRDETIAQIVCNSHSLDAVIWGVIHGLCPPTAINSIPKYQLVTIMQYMPYVDFMSYPSFIKYLITLFGVEETFNMFVNILGEDRKKEISDRIIGIIAIDRRKHILSARLKGGRRTRRKRKSRKLPRLNI